VRITFTGTDDSDEEIVLGDTTDRRLSIVSYHAPQTREIQVTPLMRSETQFVAPRYNKKIAIAFSVAQTHDSYEAALAHVVGYADTLPYVGTLTVSQGTTFVSYSGAVLTQIDPSGDHKGVSTTTHFSFTASVKINVQEQNSDRPS
jgi:hypothetical protein